MLGAGAVVCKHKPTMAHGLSILEFTSGRVEHVKCPSGMESVACDPFCTKAITPPSDVRVYRISGTSN